MTLQCICLLRTLCAFAALCDVRTILHIAAGKLRSTNLIDYFDNLDNERDRPIGYVYGGLLLFLTVERALVAYLPRMRILSLHAAVTFSVLVPCFTLLYNKREHVHTAVYLHFLFLLLQAAAFTANYLYLFRERKGEDQAVDAERQRVLQNIRDRRRAYRHSRTSDRRSVASQLVDDQPRNSYVRSIEAGNARAG